MSRKQPGLSPLQVECYKLGLRLGQISRIHDLNLAEEVSEHLALKTLVAAVCSAFSKISGLADLAGTTLSRMRGAGSRRELRPLFDGTFGRAQVLGIAREFVVASDQLAGHEHELAAKLRDWFEAGLEIGQVEEDRRGLHWRNPEKLEKMLARIGKKSGDLCIEGSPPSTLPEDYYGPNFMNFDYWWRIEEGCTRLEAELATGGSRAPQHQQVVATPNTKVHGEDPKADVSKLQIERWERLGIGLDAGGKKFYLFHPRPQDGERIGSSSGLPLSLRAGQLQRVLNLLAGSEDGRSASKDDLLAALKITPRPRGSISHQQATHHEKLTVRKPSPNRRLESAMAGLGESLRRHVRSAGGTAFKKHGEGYQASFVTRVLRMDGKNHMCFGTKPANGAG